MSITTQEFDFVRQFVATHAGICLENGKEYLVDMRLAPVARLCKFSSVTELIAGLRNRSDPALNRLVIDAMTTNETSFFRDLHPFEVLRLQVIPEMMKLRGAERRLAIWCGASSTGQEPYTIAMLIREHFPDLTRWKLDFIATDISEGVLAKAREGLFNQVEINRGLPASYVVKYFKTDPKGWRLNDDVRKMVDFRYLNLIQTWPQMPSFDVVFMRNVMIYFDVATKKTILRKIAQTMRRDGYLFLGGSETTLNLDDSYERVPLGKTVGYRVGKNVGAAPVKKGSA